MGRLPDQHAGDRPVEDLVSRACQPIIGIIDDGPIWNHFRLALRDLGYIEGQTIAFE
jgi:hypothetical protein